jgi:hypothetical protein
VRISNLTIKSLPTAAIDLAQRVVASWIGADKNEVARLATFLADLHASMRQEDGLFAVFVDTLIDAVWLADLQLTVTGDRPRLAVLVKELESRKFVSALLLKERLEAELMEAAELIPSSANWTRKAIRLNTAMLCVFTF